MHRAEPCWPRRQGPRKATGFIELDQSTGLPEVQRTQCSGHKRDRHVMAVRLYLLHVLEGHSLLMLGVCLPPLWVPPIPCRATGVPFTQCDPRHSCSLSKPGKTLLPRLPGVRRCAVSCRGTIESSANSTSVPVLAYRSPVSETHACCMTRQCQVQL